MLPFHYTPQSIHTDEVTREAAVFRTPVETAALVAERIDAYILDLAATARDRCACLTPFAVLAD